MASGKFAIRSEVGRAPVRRLSSKGAIWSHRLIGLGRQPFKLEMLGSTPAGTTIQVEENPYNLIIKIFYPIKRVKK